MHYCLHIEEILASIFEFVHCNVPSLSHDKRSVLALVKTCRTFSLPARRVLWKNLSSPIPLLLTMPRDLWHVEEADNTISTNALQTLVSNQNLYLARKPNPMTL